MRFAPFILMIAVAVVAYYFVDDLPTAPVAPKVVEFKVQVTKYEHEFGLKAIKYALVGGKESGTLFVDIEPFGVVNECTVSMGGKVVTTYHNDPDSDSQMLLGPDQEMSDKHLAQFSQLKTAVDAAIDVESLEWLNKDDTPEEKNKKLKAGLVDLKDFSFKPVVVKKP